MLKADHQTQLMSKICILNINDEPPFFQPSAIEVRIPENTVGFVSDFRAIDPDGVNDDLSYSIIGDSFDFRLFPNGSLYLEKPLDFETQNQLHLQTVANDTKHTSEILDITISVENLNDNAPVFSQTSQTVELYENEPTDTVLAIIQANDDDFHVEVGIPPLFGVVTHYQIVEDGLPFEVRFDSQTNSAILVNTRPLDFEVDNCSYLLTVVAFDGEGVASRLNASVLVVVKNLNDNVIQFANETYYFSLKENHVGSFASLQLDDLDSLSSKRCPSNQSIMIPEITYSLFGQNIGDNVFNISSDGQLSALQSLDYESQDNPIILVVSALDGFFSSIATLIITLQDENEFCPSARESTIFVSIPETIRVDSQITEILVSDADGSGDDLSTLYELLDSGSSLPFAVGPSGGVILAAPLDYEANQTLFVFSVRIHDNSGMCNGSIVIVQVEVTNENDEAPYFLERSYTFIASESLQPLSAAGQITAIDPDLMESDPQGLQFILDPVDTPFIVSSIGEVILIRSLDFEEESMIHFTVQAFDGTQSSEFSTNVTVLVQNVNEHSPEFLGPFSFNLTENELRSFQVNVVDQDKGSWEG